MYRADGVESEQGQAGNSCGSVGFGQLWQTAPMCVLPGDTGIQFILAPLMSKGCLAPSSSESRRQRQTSRALPWMPYHWECFEAWMKQSPGECS